NNSRAALMDDKTYWVNADIFTRHYEYHPKLTLAFSIIGNLLFGLIIYSCYKRGVIRKYINDIFPILAFAFTSSSLASISTFFEEWRIREESPAESEKLF
ncbi:hypothetical protein PENTCL1PPCAC_21573, partial [Pristionchus entomophagus]